MDVVVELLARSNVNALSEQAHLLANLQHELFQRREFTQWQAPDDAGQCISAARVIICQLGAFPMDMSLFVSQAGGV